MGMIPSKPNTVNAQGSQMSVFDSIRVGLIPENKRGDFLLNWLSAGGPPKPLDPGQVFADAQAAAPMEAAAAKGRGFGGLFGTGSMIGELAPITPLKSPLQPGVPYSVPAIPKLGGG